MSRQVAVSKTLDRCSEETLYFNIQVEKSIIEEVSQFGAYSGLAYAADTSEEYAHVAILDGAMPFWSNLAIIGDSRGLLPGLLTPVTKFLVVGWVSATATTMTGGQTRGAANGRPRGVVQDRRPSQIYRLKRVAGCGIIGAWRSNSAHLHRPWRASTAESTISSDLPRQVTLDDSGSLAVRLLA